MKKVLLLCLMACFTVAANAQFSVGGTLGFSTEHVKHAGTTTTFQIAPEFGYELNEAIELGIEVGAGYGHMNHDDLRTFALTPYVRAKFAKVSCVDFFAEAAFSYKYMEWDDADVDADGWGIGIRPGFIVNMTKNWKLIGKTTLLEYSKMDDVKTTGFHLNGHFEMGVLYCF